MGQIDNQMQKNMEPQLAPPGAGLTWFQHIILKYYVGPFVSNRTTRDESKRRFDKIVSLITAELSSLSSEQLLQKKLVPPMMGLEDSSRYWSVAMTLEHIVIVGRAMCSVILCLQRGETPNFVADVAKVKPLGHMTQQQAIKEFNTFVSVDYPKMNKEFQDFENKSRFLHPWFGAIKPKQWYWLITTHTAIHLNQIREIKKLIN